MRKLTQVAIRLVIAAKVVMDTLRDGEVKPDELAKLDKAIADVLDAVAE